MSLTKIIQDGQLQIHMLILGEVRSQAETMADDGEMIHIEHFSEIIGLIEEELIAPLEKKWEMRHIMWIILMKIGVIRISNVAVRKFK